MKKLNDIIQWRTVSGNPVSIGDTTITPHSQTLTIRWRSQGGLVWNRPVAVFVERGTQTERIPIIDTTRIVQLGLLALSLAIAIATMAMTTRQRRN